MNKEIEYYYNLKGRELKDSGLFVVEGQKNVERLLESNWPMHSLLCTPRLYHRFQVLSAGRCPVFQLPPEDISEIVGFNFHRGVLALGTRPPRPDIGAFLDLHPQANTLVVATHISEEENMGVIIRSAVALGAQGIICSNRGCDPFSRRVVRTSMGAIFKLPLIFSSSSEIDISTLKHAGFQLISTVLKDDSSNIGDFIWPEKTALIVGHETAGIEEEWSKCSTHQVQIPMLNGIDSLNVSVATSICLFHRQLQKA